ncbi:hypothetical protein Hdeb2414_s0002g00080131 [Helianthus debilis subsp. tardiflorus]
MNRVSIEFKVFLKKKSKVVFTLQLPSWSSCQCVAKCGSVYHYRVRFFAELDRLPASKVYLHFINMKCFSHTGFKSCPNDVRETIDLQMKNKIYIKNLHRK